MSNKMLKVIGITFLAALIIMVFAKPIRNHTTKEAQRTTNMTTENRILKGSDSRRLELDKRHRIQDEIMGHRLQSKTRIEQIQIALKNSGFYEGEIDGVSGFQTKKAVKEFQRSKGLTPDGIVGPKTWEELSDYLNNFK